MTNQEKIEAAELAIKEHQERLTEWQAKLSNLKARPEPKEGEWWKDKVGGIGRVQKK